ncbi:hypothetical protein ABIE52_006734 [Rhodococcus sp. OAS809]|uniref:hypothetical protein n=1 Tax=Rhodococcus sp. OAS809 TaxID=2663874 RepID=UPI00178AC349
MSEDVDPETAKQLQKAIDAVTPEDIERTVSKLRKFQAEKQLPFPSAGVPQEFSDKSIDWLVNDIPTNKPKFRVKGEDDQNPD